MLIFYAPIYRTTRSSRSTSVSTAGRTRSMTIVRIAAHPIEWQIYKMTDTRKEAQNSILELYGERAALALRMICSARVGA